MKKAIAGYPATGAETANTFGGAVRVRRVMWKTDARNERSRAAILRLGARNDGVLRAQRVAPDSVGRDTAFFSILSSEWPEARARLVARLARG